MDTPWPLFLVLLTAWTSVSLSAAQKKCEPPLQVQRFTADQLNGGWATQMLVNFGNEVFYFTCGRIDMTFQNDSKDGLFTYAVFNRSDGHFTLDAYKATIVKNEVLHLRRISDPTRIALLYFWLINKDVYVVTTCFLKGGVLQLQYEAVATRSQTITEAHAFELFREAGVTYRESYFYNNSNNCYKLNAGCQCPAG